jgi:hypothetical protein
MGFRTRTAVALATALALLTMIMAPAGTAGAYDFPSTNDTNRDAGLPHVNELSKGQGTVTLEFVNPRVALSYFEYRIDGEILPIKNHPIVIGDPIYFGVYVDGRSSPTYATSPVIVSFSANATVEVRLALGGERDWDFDWVEFTVGPTDPTTKADCNKGGWADFGFRNQGQCIRFVNTGKDSR